MKIYRLITGDDTKDYCHKVTEALSKGWELHGSSNYAYDAARGSMRCGQAVVKDVDIEYNRNLLLGDL
ncbi:MAG: DUF1737 domain-containing protein [Amylibacter sp.]